MTRSGEAPRDPAARTIDQELQLIEEAVAMVASGGSPRVVLGNLRFGEQLVEQARAMAVGSPVRIVALWAADEGRPDISVEKDS